MLNWSTGIPQAVKEAVHRVDPTATVILYGSRARGDAKADSDWDFLILFDRPVDTSLNDAVNYELFLAELDCGEIISGILRERSVWDSELYSYSDLRTNVRREGIVV